MDGLGAESLREFGLIVGETSHADDDTFTIAPVTAHSVGISADSIRRGECAAQVEGQQLLLSGKSRLWLTP